MKESNAFDPELLPGPSFVMKRESIWPPPSLTGRIGSLSCLSYTHTLFHIHSLSLSFTLTLFHSPEVPFHYHCGHLSVNISADIQYCHCNPLYCPASITVILPHPLILPIYPTHQSSLTLHRLILNSRLGNTTEYLVSPVDLTVNLDAWSDFICYCMGAWDNRWVTGSGWDADGLDARYVQTSD